MTAAFQDLYPVDAAFDATGSPALPRHFGDADAEYQALREGVGLLDLSSVGLVAVRGRGAEGLLQQACTKDVAFLSPDRSVSSLLLSEAGEPLDVLVVYRVDDGYLVETSFGRGAATAAELAAMADGDVEVADRSDELLALGLEGPDVWECVDDLVRTEVSGLPFQGVQRVEVDGEPVLVSRTGYSGEFGVKLLAAPDVARALWQRAAGPAAPAGFDALEATMLEVRQPALHLEVRPGDSVIGTGLNWLVDLDKEDFRGRAAVDATRDGSPEALPVSFVVDGTRSCAPGTPVRFDGEPVGEVVCGSWSPRLAALVGIARLDPAWAASGLEFEVADGGVPLRSVSSPATIPTSWRRLVA